MIELAKVSKSFGAHQVLRDVDLSVGRSEVVCLIGPSGSGKSTLLRCVNFLEPYDSGDLRIDGRLIGYEDAPDRTRRLMAPRALREMRREIGMVFQHFADQLGIERRRRLVEQHEPRLHRQRPRNSDALLLAARET